MHTWASSSSTLAGWRVPRPWQPLRLGATVWGGRRPPGLAVALVALVAPVAFVLLCEAAGLHRLGYTRSLVLFLVPVAAGAAWLLGDRGTRRAIDWRSLAATVGAWTVVGWVLDLTLAATFFRFPCHEAVTGIHLPGFDLATGDVMPVPLEEFAFYLLGFLIAIVAYLWLDRSVFPGGSRRPRPARPRRVHAPTLVAGLLALGLAWSAKGSLPGYALFLVVAVVLPNAFLVPRAAPRLNARALATAMAVLFVLAAFWEATLALPNGWWAYDEAHMSFCIATPWSRLPIEAVAVWLLWPWTTVLTYEALRSRRSSGQPASLPLLSLSTATVRAKAA